MNETQKKIYEEQTALLLESGIISAEVKNTFDAIRNTVDTITAQKLQDGTEEDKNKLYAEFKEAMMAYGKTLSETTYTVHFTKDEYSFMHDVVMRKLTYNRQDLFIAKQVVVGIFEAFPVKKEQSLAMSIELVTWLSFLIGKFEVEGFGKTANLFLSVVEKLTNASRVFDVYNKRGEELSTQGANWVAQLDEEEDDVTVATDDRDDRDESAAFEANAVTDVVVEASFPEGDATAEQSL